MTIEIIPAIDLIDGKCVRLCQGEYHTQVIYSGDPVDMAMRYEAAGLRRLHLVDLDGARLGHIVNYRFLEKICNRTSLRVDFGGGISSDDDMHVALECGAKQVSVGTKAVKDEAQTKRWFEQYGEEIVILGADVKQGKVAISGWKAASELSVAELILRYKECKLKYLICTDIAKDGMLQGPGFEIYEQIRKEFPDLKLIASGGVSSIAQIEQLAEIGVFGAILGKALYEDRLKLIELRRFL